MDSTDITDIMFGHYVKHDRSSVCLYICIGSYAFYFTALIFSPAFIPLSQFDSFVSVFDVGFSDFSSFDRELWWRVLKLKFQYSMTLCPWEVKEEENKAVLF